MADRHSGGSVADRLPLNDRHSALNERALSERHMTLSERLERDRVERAERERSLNLASRHPGASAISERLLMDKTRAHAAALSERGAPPGLSERMGGVSERLSGGPASPSHHHFAHRAGSTAEKIPGVYSSDHFSVKTLAGIGDKTLKRPEDDRGGPDSHSSSLDRGVPDRHYDPISRSMDNQTLNERLHMSSLASERLHGSANGLHQQIHNGLKRSLDEQLSTHIAGHRDKKYMDPLQQHDHVDRERFRLHEKERFAHHIHHPRLPYPSPPPGGHRSPLRGVGSQPYLPARTMPNGGSQQRPEMIPSPPTHPHSSTYSQLPPHHVHPFSTAHR